MAGSMLGAAAPFKRVAAAPAVSSLYRPPASTRTRRLQGVCLSGTLLLSVYSSRRAIGNPAEAVCIAVHQDQAEQLRHMSIAQAHALARQIECGADAGDHLGAAVMLAIGGATGDQLAQLQPAKALELARAIRAAADAAEAVARGEG